VLALHDEREHRLRGLAVPRTTSAIIACADNTMACTNDDDQDGCQGRGLRHEGDTIRCWTWTLSGCNDCGVQ
jgi:hypothetical protein